MFFLFLKVHKRYSPPYIKMSVFFLCKIAPHICQYYNVYLFGHCFVQRDLFDTETTVYQ